MSRLEAWLLQKFLDEFDISLDSVDSDIFSAGVDSLQTMRMWRLITKELDLGGRSTELSQNIVFEQGTVKSLANYLYALRTRDTAETTNDIKIMSEMIQKYSRFNRQAPKDPARTDRDCVVRTTTCQIHGTQTNTSSSLLLVPLEILAAIYWLTLLRKKMYRRFLLP
jgi:acyl carrier protein